MPGLVPGIPTRKARSRVLCRDGRDKPGHDEEGNVMRAAAASSSGQSVSLTTGHAARLAVRAGTFAAPTCGVAPDYVQGNLAILPADHAEDFLRFCQANPKPCPLIGVSEKGDPTIPA